MRTDDLIARLGAELEPVRNGALGRMLLAAVAAGIFLSAAVMLTVLGLRPDASAAMATFGMWMKLSYTLALAAFGFWLVERAGRPGAPLGAPAALLALPLLAILLLSGLQMAAPGANIEHLVIGQSSRWCAANILLVALPTLGVTFLALRRMAPTRLALAGAVSGLFAGAAGAFVYSFHCMEGAAPFVAIWYTLGIALTAAIGALLGRAALRW